MSDLSSHAGSWAGTSDLWLEDPGEPERSDATAVVEASTIRYTWAFRGRQQSGGITLRSSDGAARAEWTDTWHNPEPMACVGTSSDHLVEVLGHYAAGEGPDWGWRTAIDTSDPDRLEIRMFNIHPGGRVDRAVLMTLSRAPAG